MAGKSIDQVEAFWDSYSEEYTTYDCGASVFYLSLLNMLKIEKRKSILEVGAGAGFLYNHTLNRKSAQAKYTATDLSEKMLFQMFKRLKMEGDFKKGLFSQKNNLVIEKANGESLSYADGSFDCYIANLCLQLTTNPDKMVQESYRVLDKGGVVGFTVWGLEQKSVWTIIPDILTELGIQMPEQRSHFHLSDKTQLIKMMEDAGYTNVITWTQFSPYSYTCDEDILKFLELSYNVSILQLAGDRQEEVKQKVIERFKDYIYIKKQAIGHCGLLVIGTKN
ncbi:hypothetical protein ABPG74_009109 [Tetrahymena malaccensis]